MLSATTMATKPRYPFALAAYFSAGLGSGCADAGFCAWAAAVCNADTVQGLIHGSFSVGSVIGPLIVAAVDKAGYTWNTFYLVAVRSCFLVSPTITFLTIIQLGIFMLEFGSLLLAFRCDDGAVYRTTTRVEETTTELTIFDGKRPILHCALFFLCYVGMESTLPNSPTAAKTADVY